MAGLKTFWQDRTQRWAGVRLSCIAAMLLFCSPMPASAQDAKADIIDIANLTLVALPTQAIATIKGGSFQGPGFGSAATPNRSITLWDELKPPVKPPNEISGISVITVNGVAK